MPINPQKKWEMLGWRADGPPVPCGLAAGLGAPSDVSNLTL